MTREEELIIIIKHLKDDVVYTSKNYSRLLESTIVKNGKLIEQYLEELKEVRND